MFRTIKMFKTHKTLKKNYQSAIIINYHQTSQMVEISLIKLPNTFTVAHAINIVTNNHVQSGP